jgi:pyruvate ferredoxin oxidoreductase delta subunit
MKKYPEIYPVSYPQHGTAGETGSWRFNKPIIDPEKCTKCLLCWIYCPDAVIDRDSLEINYQYCKGCGVCAEECPAKAISMVREEAE